MGSSINKIENSLKTTIEDSLFEILIQKMIIELTKILKAKQSSDNDVTKKQKILIKILIDAKNEMLSESKNQLVSKNYSSLSNFN